MTRLQDYAPSPLTIHFGNDTLCLHAKQFGLKALMEDERHTMRWVNDWLNGRIQLNVVYVEHPQASEQICIISLDFVQ